MKPKGSSPQNEKPRWLYAPSPIGVPPALLDAFESLKADAVLVGGAAAQVWTGKSDGVFQTWDLDFITHLTVKDLARAGLHFEASGRHALVEGVPIEFPSGPLGVGDYLYVQDEAVVPVPTVDGRRILCLRPEASVLDRLVWVASDRLGACYGQAAGVAVSQHRQVDWDATWIDRVADKAGIGKLWTHLRGELESGSPSQKGLLAALEMGWD